jgi:uncharacterized protein with PQ loop repeat
VAAPDRVALVGGLTGVFTGLLLTAFSTSPQIAALAAQSSSSQTVTPFFWIWSIAMATMWLTFGMIAERVGRTRTVVGVLGAGGMAGLTAGIFAWATGAGGAIAAVINRGVLAEAGRLAAIVETPDQFVKVLSGPATSAAFAAGWLSPLVPLVLGVGFGLLGAVASRFVRINTRPVPEAVFTYLELVAPAALGMLMLAVTAIGDAAGLVASQHLWFGPIAVFAVAALCWLTIRHGVPATTRLAGYLGLSGLIARLLGSAMPTWIEVLVYLMAIALIIVFVQSPPREPRPGLE